MNLNRRHFTGLAAAALATPLLSACGGGGGGQSADDAKSGDTFTYWSMWTNGEDQQEVLAAAFAEFTKETGIKVDVQWSGREVLNQVVPRLNAGNPPDLIDQGSTDVKAQLGLDNVESLDDVYDLEIPDEGKKVADVIPESLMTTLKTSEGSRFMVPYEVIGGTLWYNARITPEFTTPPSSWDDLMGVLDKLKSKGRTPIALDGDIPDYCAYWLEWPVLRAAGGGSILKAVGDKTGAAFEDKVWVEAAKAVSDLVKGGYFPKGFQGTKFPTQQASWADQTSKTDVVLMGSWLPSEATASLTKAKKDSTSIEFASFPFPSFGDDKGAGLVEAQPIGFAIPKNARKAGAAKKFMAWFMNKERLSGIASQAKNLTPRTDIEAPAALSSFFEEFKNAKSTVPFTDGIVSEEPKWVSDVWQPAVVQLFGGKISPDAFCSQLKSKTAEYHKNK